MADKVIDMLRPESELHGQVLKYLMERLELAEREMSNFYPRWQVMEKKVQAYVDLPDWEKVLKNLNDKGEPAKAISVTIPYSFATIWAIVTYLIHTFAGQKPMFQVGSYRSDAVGPAAMMEIVLQYNADHTRLIKHLWQFLQDGEIYGCGVLQTAWKVEKKMRTVWNQSPKFDFWGQLFGMNKNKTREERTTYAGNEVRAIDPFMLFPDPRVPLQEVNKRGEFVAWRVYEGEHFLKKEAAAGVFKWIEAVGDMPSNNTYGANYSNRNLLAGGSSHAGSRNDLGAGIKKFAKQLDQMSIEIIPNELFKGRDFPGGDKPQKWIFTIGNKKQIIQAEPMDADHGMHPVVIAEPYSMGYGFGNLGMADFLGPWQDTLSFLVNSHIYNVRTALNNMFVVDPTMVEVKDMKNPDAGLLVRLKKAAWGKDVRSAVSQLQVFDVTQQHMSDFGKFMQMGDVVSAVNDNLRGIQAPGGRKTATEVRTSGEAGASRLAAHATLISAQAIIDLTEQMSMNNQQYLEDDFYIDVVGQQGLQDHIRMKRINFDPAKGTITPESLAGDFYFPVHDGTLPLDRVALLDAWTQIFQSVATDPALQGQFSLSGIFEHLAKLAGAKNIDQFKVNLQVAPDQQVQQQAQAGNAIPLGGQGGRAGGGINTGGGAASGGIQGGA